ncbi:hypothetical protein VTI28DRAFT_4182 [Corynascus sepedonium]
MRILCLHGVGSSGKILESQLHSFTLAVDHSYEFVFVDGPFSCERGPGIPAFLDGPFFSHTAGYSPEKMAEAHEHLEATIDELGPFDGVLGFSQGGALAISYMYKKQMQHKIQPFKFAMIMSSVIPISANLSDCESVIQRLCVRSTDGNTQLSSLDHDARISTEVLERIIVEARKNRALLPNIDLSVYSAGGDVSSAPRLMHPQLLKGRIWTPTVHVTGKKDYPFMRVMSEVARGVCDPRMAKQLEHSGGHHPPQKAAEVKAVVRAMDWAITQSQRIGHIYI